MRIHRFIPVFPLLFAIYPVLNLYASNINRVQFSQTLRSVVVLPVATVALWMAMNRVSRDSTKNAFLISVVLLSFFSYGPLFQAINLIVAPFLYIRNRYFMIIYFGATVLTVLVTMKKGRDWRRAVPYLNLAAVVLIALPLFRIGLRMIGDVYVQATRTDFQQSAPQHVALHGPPGRLPDIYYIILDGYGGDDVLRDYYDYDNTAFIGFLESRGFYVARDSHSNYALTVLSLASSLNMEYLSYLNDSGRPASANESILLRKVKDNRVVQTLHANGYSYVQVASGLEPTDDNPFADIQYRYGYLNPFETLLGRTTFALNYVLTSEMWTRRILYNFDELSKIPKVKGPKFVFAHFLIPHPPNVFDRHGRPLPTQTLLTQQLALEGAMNGWSHKNGYVDQVIFVNKKLESLIDDILSQSQTRPIIVLQGDHGPAVSGVGGGWEHASHMLSRGQWDLASERLVRERMSIFNAYYLPGAGNSRRLYASITPVNSFRLILDTYLGTDFGLLEDKSYFSTYFSTGVYDFFLVPESILKGNADYSK